jgi:hypothetical protein
MRLLLAAVALIALAPGCGGDEAQAPAVLTGVVVEVRSQGASVEAFTLDADGDTYTIYIADDVDYGFDLTHLHEHRATREAVRCTLEERGERLYALAIVDAVPS